MPSSTLIHWLWASECFAEWPLLCPEKKLMQYRSPVVKRSRPVFPNRGLCYNKSPNSPPLPQNPDTNPRT